MMWVWRVAVRALPWHIADQRARAASANAIDTQRHMQHTCHTLGPNNLPAQQRPCHWSSRLRGGPYIASRAPAPLFPPAPGPWRRISAPATALPRPACNLNYSEPLLRQSATLAGCLVPPNMCRTSAPPSPRPARASRPRRPSDRSLPPPGAKEIRMTKNNSRMSRT